MHYPAHESLQEFQERTGGTYEQWHNRPYLAFKAKRLVEMEGRRVVDVINHEYRGPGLGLRR